MTTLRELAGDLEPPRGGLARLRLRIEGERQRRHRRAMRFAVVPALAAAALLLFFVFPRQAQLELDHPSLSRDWPELELVVDGQPYQPWIEDGVVWIVPKGW